MKDYWSFAPVLETFRSVGYGKFQTINGLEYRTRGGDYVLISPPQEDFLIPENANRDRIRSLSYVEGIIGVDVPKRPVGKLWVCDNLWTPNRKTRYELRQAHKVGYELRVPTQDALNLVFDSWVQELTESCPSKMLVKGHYREMIKHPGFDFLGVYVDGVCVGATGVTFDGTSGAVCFTKHERQYRWLSRVLWFHSIDYLVSSGCTFINCGDTADKLKRELGFTSTPQYKVDFSTLEQENGIQV